MEPLSHHEAEILISVVVSTFNRPNWLIVVLDSLVTQTLCGAQFEIIVVDNNSTDNTKEVVGQYAAQGVRYFLEREQGLSASRNRGWREARGEYISYLDDDCKVPLAWLERVYEVIQEHTPLCFGGPCLPFYITDKPKWYSEKYGSYLDRETAHFLEDGVFLVGGNSIFKRSLLSELGGFSHAFGMSGEKLGYSEETEFQLRVQERYGKNTLYFVPTIWVYHLVRPEKMKWRWIIKNHWSSGRFDEKMMLSHLLPNGRLSVAQRMEACIAFIGYLKHIPGSVYKAYRRDKTRYPYFQNYIYEVTMRHIMYAAVLYERIVHTA